MLSATTEFLAKGGLDEGVAPCWFPRSEDELFELYAEVSGKPVGQGVGVLRDVIVADTDEEANALWRNASTFVASAWFEPFGFYQGLADPKGGPPIEDFFATSLALVGSPDAVVRQLEALQRRLPVEWIFAWEYISLIPNETLKKSIELFATKVLPRVTSR